MERDVRELPALALAYMGDAVWEITVRRRVLGRGEVRPDRLHRSAVRYANARAQALALHYVWDTLTEPEQRVALRGRNAKSNTVPKNADLDDYRRATALETLIGYWYLTGQEERLKEMMEQMFTAIDTGRGNA